MSEKRSPHVALLGLAGVLGVGFFVVTVGVWSSLRPVGDLLVTAIVLAAVVAAGANGYWDGSPVLGVSMTALVAGGHLVGEYVRSLRAIRLPPAQSRYSLLVVGFAVVIGVSAHVAGRWVASRDNRFS